MRQSLFIWFSFLIVCGTIFYSCTTKDGSLTSDNGSGIVYINLTGSDAEARVVINDIPSKYKTPCEFALNTGHYTIKLLYHGYKAVPDSHSVTIKPDEKNQFLELKFKMEAVFTGDLKILSEIEDYILKIDNVYRQVNNNIISKISTGKHNLKISKAGYNTYTEKINIKANETNILSLQLVPKSRLYLVEHFSNVSCDPCVERDEDLENYIHVHDSIEFISLGYHLDFPSDTDPMYLAALEENDHRKEFYNVGSTPSIFINGTKIQTYSQKHIYKGLDSYITKNITNYITTSFSIEVENTIGEISGVVKILSKQEVNHHKLRIVLIEKDINFDTPPGSNGMQHFTDIVREIYPEPKGLTISLKPKLSESFPYTIPLNTLWEKDLQLVAFIQNEETREILAITRSVIINN